MKKKIPRGKLEIRPPASLPEYQWPAWYGCLHWAIGEAEILAAFKAETGMAYRPPQCAIDAAIDESTGFQEAFVAAFVAWFNENVWGA